MITVIEVQTGVITDEDDESAVDMGIARTAESIIEEARKESTDG